jgi:hypothetical protein
MIHYKPQREHFAPKGAIKVADKHSDGVVYLYTSARGRPCAIAFHGKAQRPDFHFSFKDEAARERRVREFFEGRQARARFQAEQKATATQPHKLEVGHILVASWGYEQTNVDWFEVTKVISSTMVEVRPISSNVEETASMQGRCFPLAGVYAGPPKRCRVRWGDSVKINESVRAHLWDGRPRHWSSYH